MSINTTWNENYKTALYCINLSDIGHGFTAPLTCEAWVTSVFLAHETLITIIILNSETKPKWNDNKVLKTNLKNWHIFIYALLYLLAGVVIFKFS